MADDNELTVDEIIIISRTLLEDENTHVRDFLKQHEVSKTLKELEQKNEFEFKASSLILMFFKDVQVLLSMIRIAQDGAQLMRILTTETRNCLHFPGILANYQDGDINIVLQEIFSKLSDSQCKKLVCQVKDFDGSTLMDKLAQKSNAVLKTLSKHMNVEEGLGYFILFLNRHNLLVKDDSTALHNFWISYKDSDVDSFDALIALIYLIVSGSLDNDDHKYLIKKSAEARFQKLLDIAKKIGKNQSESITRELWDFLTTADDKCILQASVYRWSFMKALLSHDDHPLELDTFRIKIQAELDKPRVELTTDIKDVSSLLSKFHDEKLVLMLVKDASMLLTMLNACPHDQRYMLLTRHYKADPYINIETPAILKILCDCEPGEFVPILNAVKKSLPQECWKRLLNLHDSEGRTVAHMFFANRQVDNENTITMSSTHSCISFKLLRSVIDDDKLLTQLLLRFDWSGESPISLLWCYEPKYCNPLLETIVNTIDADHHVRLLKTKITAIEDKTLAHFAIGTGETDMITKILEKLTAKQKYDLLQTTDKLGNTPLHQHLCAKLLHHRSIAIDKAPAESLSTILTAKNKQGNTIFHKARTDGSTFKKVIETKENRLKVLAIQNNYGETILHCKLRSDCKIQHKHPSYRFHRIDGKLELRLSHDSHGTQKLIDFLKALELKSLHENEDDFLYARDKEGLTVLDILLQMGSNAPIIPFLKLLNSQQIVKMFGGTDSTEGVVLKHKSAAHEIATYYPQYLDYIMEMMEEPDQLTVIKIKEGSKNETVLHVLADKYPKFLPAIMEKIPQNHLNVVLEHQNDTRSTIFHILAKKAAPELSQIQNKVHTGISKEEAINLLSIKDANDASVLHYAVAKQDSSSVRAMVQYQEIGRERILRDCLGLDKENGITKSAIETASKAISQPSFTFDATSKDMLKKFKPFSRSCIPMVLERNTDTIIIDEMEEEELNQVKSQITSMGGSEYIPMYLAAPINC